MEDNITVALCLSQRLSTLKCNYQKSNTCTCNTLYKDDGLLPAFKVYYFSYWISQNVTRRVYCPLTCTGDIKSTPEEFFK